MSDLHVGQFVQLKNALELADSGWKIKGKEYVPPYWKEPCGIPVGCVMIGAQAVVIDVRPGTPLPYHLQMVFGSRLTVDKLWAPGSMIKQ